jgi:hypothetical protein
MGNIYTQLSPEERTMIHTQLERGITSAAMARGLIRSASTLSRTPSKRLDSTDDGSRLWTTSDGRAATVPMRPLRAPDPSPRGALCLVCGVDPVTEDWHGAVR